MRPFITLTIMTALLAFEANADSSKIRKLSEAEVVDIIAGASIQASRSGQSSEMIRRAYEAIADGTQFTLIDPQHLPDSWHVVAAGAVGGGGAWPHVTSRMNELNVPELSDGSVRSIEALSNHIGQRFDAVIRVEASAGAMLRALLAAAELGVPVVDACLSGRARPETQQQIPWLHDIPSTPAALVSLWGDVVILANAVDDYRSEDLGRGIAVASGGGAWMALTPMTGDQVKRATIHGAVSQAMALGQASRKAREQNRDPIAAVLDTVQGYKLFHGVVSMADTKGDRGFTWWDVELDGIGSYSGHTYKVFVKNENIVAWLDGMVDATAPDFIQNLDPKTGNAISHTELGGYTIGEEVVMIAWPASPLWRTSKGLDIFGPRHFGFDFDYTPLEDLQRRRSVLTQRTDR